MPGEHVGPGIDAGAREVDDHLRRGVIGPALLVGVHAHDDPVRLPARVPNTLEVAFDVLLVGQVVDPEVVSQHEQVAVGIRALVLVVQVGQEETGIGILGNRPRPRRTGGR